MDDVFLERMGPSQAFAKLLDVESVPPFAVRAASQFLVEGIDRESEFRCVKLETSEPSFDRVIRLKGRTLCG